MGNYTLDYIKYLTFGIAAPLVIKWIDVKILIDDGNFEFFTWVCIILGFSLISYAYCWSFYFKN